MFRDREGKLLEEGCKPHLESLDVHSESGKNFKIEYWNRFRGRNPRRDLPIKEGYYVSYWGEHRYMKIYVGPFETPFDAGEEAQELADDWDIGLSDESRWWTPPSNEGCICSERVVRFRKDYEGDKWALQRWHRKHGDKEVITVGHTDTSNKAFGKNVEATEEHIDDNFKSVVSGFYEDSEGNIWEEGMIGEAAREGCKCKRCVEIREYEAKLFLTS